MSWGNAQSLADAYRAMDDAKERAARDADRTRTRELLVRAEAARAAQQDLANAMVAELKELEDDSLSQRSLSDASNRELRVAYVVVQEHSHLQRLSGGRLNVDSDRLQTARETQRAEAAKQTSKKGVKP